MGIVLQRRCFRRVVGVESRPGTVKRTFLQSRQKINYGRSDPRRWIQAESLDAGKWPGHVDAGTQGRPRCA